jgi:hypothetical protein
MAPMFRGLLAGVVLLVVSTGAVHAQQPASDSQAVVAMFMALLDRHELDQAAQLVAPDGQVVTPGPVNGREDILTWLRSHYPEDSVVEVTGYSADANRVTWTTRVNRQSGTQSWSRRYIVTTDEAIVTNGEIALWNTRVSNDPMLPNQGFRRAGTLEPAAESLVGTDRSSVRLSLPVVLSGLLLALLCGAWYGVWQVRGGGRPRRQRQDGKLLRSLRDGLRARGPIRLGEPLSSTALRD